MRILMTSNRGAGHIGPLVPFANAFLRAGDAVLVAAPAGARDTVVTAGLPFHALPDPPQDEVDALFAEIMGQPAEEQGPRVMREVFADIDARSSLPGVLRAVTDYRPHLILREPTEFAGLLAAERLGVRHGRIAIMAHATETWGVPLVAPVLDRHRKRLGLRPDPQGDRIHSSPYLTVIPEAMEDPEDLGPPRVMRFREPVAPARPLPDWWNGDDRPLVYVSYGSVTPTMAYFPALFRATVHALGDLPARVLFTIGNEVERDGLGPVPANVHVERWVPQSAVMPYAAAMVGHGGAGSTRMALAAGVPAVIVPGFADQTRNADRVAEIGAGIALEAAELAGLGEAVRRLLEQPSYRAAAQRVAADVAALPPVHEAPGELRDWALGERAGFAA
jgi:UDP:flavonoid glycosyltransferase YjiC (YdhE family)